MKIKIIGIVILCFVMAINTVCLAVSGDNITELEPGDTDFINDYDEYEQLYGEVESGYSQEDLKNVYLEYKKSMEDYYKSFNRDEAIKAKVIDVYDVEEVYELNEYYYSVSKYEIQPIKVKILEKEHKDEVYEIDYLLTGDSLNNIKYSELKVGDTIYVGIFTDEETGEIYADITNAGSNVERKGIIIFIGIIAAVLLIVYGGNKGLMATAISILIFIICLVTIPNMGYAGNGFIFGGVLLMFALLVTIPIMHLGLKKDTLRAAGVSTVLVFISSFLIIIFNYLTRTVGVTFEVAAVSENVLLGNMNFEHLYIIITLLISTVFISNVVAKSIKRISDKGCKDFNDSVKACREILSSNVLMMTITILAIYIPNHLLLLTNKYTSSEIWNSEILISELIRLFVVIISTTVAIPAVAMIKSSNEK